VESYLAGGSGVLLRRRQMRRGRWWEHTGTCSMPLSLSRSRVLGERDKTFRAECIPMSSSDLEHWGTNCIGNKSVAQYPAGMHGLNY
jgi:hypothetical protein